VSHLSCGTFVLCDRLPGLESSTQNKDEEDAMYNAMMLELLTIVLARFHPSTQLDASRQQHWDRVTSDELSQEPPNEAGSTVCDDKLLPLNMLKWKLFTRATRSNLVL
jgi:hypothetical protein